MAFFQYLTKYLTFQNKRLPEATFQIALLTYRRKQTLEIPLKREIPLKHENYFSTLKVTSQPKGCDVTLNVERKGQGSVALRSLNLTRFRHFKIYTYYIDIDEIPGFIHALSKTWFILQCKDIISFTCEDITVT